jgi:hypothetical protein
VRHEEEAEEASQLLFYDHSSPCRHQAQSAAAAYGLARGPAPLPSRSLRR